MNRLRILIIEDDENFVLSLRDLLDPPLQIISAGNGVEGLEKARAERPDLVLLDIKLPSGSARSCAGRLKRNASQS